MSDYVNSVLRPHSRIAILRFLEDAPKYTSNVSMLTTLLPGVGLTLRRSEVVEEVKWLAAEGLVTFEAAAEDFIVVTATVEGVEIAQGVALHEGVQRPRPGS